MFNKEKIQALEQSVAALTEELNKTKEIFESITKTIDIVNKKVDTVYDEKTYLEKKYNAFKKAFDETYKVRIDKTLEEMSEKSEKDKSTLREEIRKVSEIIDELKKNSDKADEKHNAQIESLTKSTDALVKKCEDIQLSNVQIMNEHRDMIKRYEESIKGYAEQTERMQNNVLKKMNANNIISVVEE